MNHKTINIGDTLPNGAILIAIDHSNETVLAMNPTAAQSYVVWDYYRHDLKTTSNGDYFRSISEAAFAYDTRRGNF